MAHDAYSALSDPTRRRLLSELRDGARPVGELVEALGVSQPTVSKHLKVLRDAKLVASRAEGQKRYYSVETAALEPVVEWIQGVISAANPPSEAAAPVAPERAPEEEAAEASLEGPLPDEERRDAPWSVRVPAEESHTPPERVHDERPEADEAAVPDSADVPVFDVLSEDEFTDTDVPSGRDRDAYHPTVEETRVTETPVTHATISDNTDVTPAADTQDDPVRRPEPVKPVYGVPEANSGFAQRRQGGLLSTLAGFGRRGRGPRR